MWEEKTPCSSQGAFKNIFFKNHICFCQDLLMLALKSEHKSKPAESKIQLCFIQYSTEESEGYVKI